MFQERNRYLLTIINSQFGEVTEVNYIYVFIGVLD